MALELVKDLCYLIDLDTTDTKDAKLTFQYVPRVFNRNRSVNMDSVAIVGKNVPSYHYTGGETTLDFELDFFAEEESRNDVMRRVAWIEALTYNEGYTEYPHRVVLSFGKMFRNQVWVVKGVSTDYSMFHKKFGFLPQQAYVKIRLGLWAELPLNASDIKRGFDNDGLQGLTPEEAQRYLQSSIVANGLEGNIDNSQIALTPNSSNLVADSFANQNLMRNMLAEQRINRTKGLITRGVDFAKLAIALPKLF